MGIESFNSFNQPDIKPNKPEVSDQIFLNEAKLKLDILDSFLETGDITSDYNHFLKITNREINYKKATTESKEDLIKNLENILSSLKEEQLERLNNTYSSEAKRMYYQEVPDTEVRVLVELLEFYK